MSKAIHEALIDVKQKFLWQENTAILVPKAESRMMVLISVMDSIRAVDPTDPAIFAKNPATGVDEALENFISKCCFRKSFWRIAKWLLFVRSKNRRNRRRIANTFELQLTSMMDVLIIIVVFLLKSYSASTTIPAISFLDENSGISASLDMPPDSAPMIDHSAKSITFLKTIAFWISFRPRQTQAAPKVVTHLNPLILMSAENEWFLCTTLF